jgi:hypothetical protein
MGVLIVMYTNNKYVIALTLGGSTDGRVDCNLKIINR